MLFRCFIVLTVCPRQALIDGPTTGVKRQVISLKRLTLTKFVVETLPRGARTSVVAKHVEKSDLVTKFKESGFGQKIAKTAIRRTLTDFDRHKVMLLQKKVLYSLGLVGC